MDKILKILDRETVSVKELRELASDESVAEIQSVEPDNKYPDRLKYNVYLTNGELYFVYVK